MSKTEEPKSNRRKSIRFHDDATTTAMVNENIPALVFSESRTGCGLILLSRLCPADGEIIGVKIGTLNSIQGKICWKRLPESQVAMIGVEYLQA